MKSNPFKNEKHNYGINSKKKKRSFKSNIYEGGTLFPSFKPENYKKRQIKTFNPFKGLKLLKERKIFVDNPNIKKRPPWLIPGLFVLGISLMVFWVGPFISNTVTNFINTRQKNEPLKNLIYNSLEYAVVKVPVTDLFDKPDMKATRKTQVLYNQLFKITDRKTYGFVKIQLEDKTEGYLKTDDIEQKTTSVEPALYQFKIVILSKSKRIMTHSSNGSTIAEVYMGTVLYSDYQGDGIYRVALPNHEDGWISASGVLKLKISDTIKKSSAKSFYTTVLSFNNSTFINQGMTQNGASSEGIAYIAAKVNGISIPRDKQSQMSAGISIPVTFDKDTGKLIYDDFKEGDLIFFKSAYDPKKVGDMGIVVGFGQVLMSKNSKSSIKILLLDDNTALAQSVLAVRRIF